VDRVKYLLVGAGVGSFNAAKRIIKADADACIAMVGKQRVPPYDLPPLSKEFLRGTKSEAQIIYESEDRLRQLGVDLRLSTRVLKLDAEQRIVTLDKGGPIQFEKAFLSPGAQPIPLSAVGAHLPGVHYLRTLDDAAGIIADASASRRAVIVGAGFIGLEVAASLVTMGLDVTVVEAMSRVWPRFADDALAVHVQQHCERNGVKFRLGEMVLEVRGDARAREVITASGAVLPADLICVGIGVRPNIKLAAEAGLRIDNGIWVDDRMRTSAAGIFAGGDAVNYPDPITGNRRRAEHWGHAEYCGQIAGMNMAGGDAKYEFISYVWSDIFDLHLEAAGERGDHDEVVVRGNMASGNFLVLYLKDGALLAYTGVNADPREFTALRRLIRSRQNLNAHLVELANPDINLRTFI
jgi:3-phenylpropionate/trans-cinnamate dioxygenase ferredoxin reductase subunit